MDEDGLVLPSLDESVFDPNAKDNLASRMLDARMLFSTLVDADYADTARHFDGETQAENGLAPESIAKALGLLHEHIARAAAKAKGKGSEEVMAVRRDLLAACGEAAQGPKGLYTLSGPTGSGKTLAMMAFALRHCLTHGLRRIVVVIPYLSIIEQTADEYHKAFGEAMGSGFVLEHHSMADARTGAPDKTEPDNDDETTRKAALIAQTWNAPIIVTTSVQFLESLHASQPVPCRKLHRLANSVIMLDEVQTIPARLAVPTLSTLSRLAERYGATVVMATATQPAFGHLDSETRKLCALGWRPREIAPPSLNLYGRMKRVAMEWGTKDEPRRMTWAEVADAMIAARTALCIVNVKRHTRRLIEALREKGAEGVEHLSTDLCPAHREAVLARVREALDKGQPCLLVATQCVEAGVDLDFPLVYRAWGPLEAIAQAAGRCNRHGRLALGKVVVFAPDDAAYPTRGYEQATSVARRIVERMLRQDKEPDLNAPAIFQSYYREFYDMTNAPSLEKGKGAEMMEAMKLCDFTEMAKLYRLIEQDTVNVLVPYDRGLFATLLAQAQAEGVSARWIRQARPLSVSLFHNATRKGDFCNYLDPLPITKRAKSEEWFVLLKEELYDTSMMGLMAPQEGEAFMVAGR